MTEDRVDPYVIRVNFPGSPKSYNYMTDIPGVQQYDQEVIVSREQLKIVTVGAPVEQTPEALGQATAWIVDKIDQTRHKERQLGQDLSDLI